MSLIPIEDERPGFIAPPSDKIPFVRIPPAGTVTEIAVACVPLILWHARHTLPFVRAFPSITFESLTSMASDIVMDTILQQRSLGADDDRMLLRINSELRGLKRRVLAYESDNIVLTKSDKQRLRRWHRRKRDRPMPPTGLTRRDVFEEALNDLAKQPSQVINPIELATVKDSFVELEDRMLRIVSETLPRMRCVCDDPQDLKLIDTLIRDYRALGAMVRLLIDEEITTRHGGAAGFSAEETLARFNKIDTDAALVRLRAAAA